MKRSHRLGLVTPALLAALAGAQVPTIGDLGFVPGDMTIGPAVNSQAEHDAATGAGQMLVVSTDYRARSVNSQAVQSDADIFGIRLDATGAPIDATPFMIAGGMGMQQRPLVAWNGANWLVLYRSQDLVGGYYEHRIRAVRVAPSGQVLDATPILLPPTQFSPSDIGLHVAGAAGQWLISRCIYHDTGYGTYLAGQRIAGDGTILDATPIMLMDWIYGQTSLVSTGSEYLAAGPDWNGPPTTYKAVRVSAAGQPVGQPFAVPSLSLGAGGGEFYVAWQPQYTQTLVGSRISLAGTLLDPAGVLLASNVLGLDHANVVHDGTRFWVQWGYTSNLRTLRLNAAGQPLDPDGGVLLPIGISGNTMAYGTVAVRGPAGGVHVLWNDGRASLGSDTNVFGIPTSAANVPGQEKAVSTGTRNQRSVDLAEGPAGASAAVYISEHAGNDRVLLQRLDPSGQPIGLEPVVVAEAPVIGRCGVAWNGAQYMVAWDDGNGQPTPTTVRARRFDAQGVAIDPAAVDVMIGFNPDVGALGDDFLIVGARFGITPQYISLYGRRFDGPTGAAIDPASVLLSASLGYVSGQSRVRSDGTRWLVATHSMWTHDSSQGDAILCRVPPAGAPQPPINPTTIAGGSGDLDVAFSGTSYLLVWRNNSLSNANNYIAGRIMNPDGSFPGASFVIAEAPGRQLRPTAVWDGSAFVVAWEDQRNQQAFFDARTDIYATRVSADGQILDPTPFPILATPQGDAGVALVGGPDRTTLAAVAQFALTPPMDTYRVRLLRVGNAACYANCDGSAGNPLLTPADFVCFLNRYRAGDSYANCDGSTGNPALTPADFVCFLARFRAGCP